MRNFALNVPCDLSQPMDDRGHRHGLNGSCRDINIAVLGAKGAGKSAMVVRYLTGRFIGDYDSQMEAIFSTNMNIDSKQYAIHIMDTATRLSGGEFKEEPVTWADGFLLVYSLTDVSSYKAVQDMVESLRKARRDERIPIMVAANKCDLVHLRQVSVTDCEAWGHDHGCLFAQVSASEDPDSIQTAFNTLCRQVRAVNKKREKLSWTLQRPAVAAKLQIRQSLRNLAEKKWRSRTSTF